MDVIYVNTNNVQMIVRFAFKGFVKNVMKILSWIINLIFVKKYKVN